VVNVLSLPGVNDFLALVRFNVLHSALRAHVIAATTPHVRPLTAIHGTAIVIDELFLRHLRLRDKDALFLAIEGP
jgi:hypothetical protein